MDGVTTLVIEHEYLIAADIEQTLRLAGASRVEVFRTIAELTDRPSAMDRVDLAVIEAKFGHADVISFAQNLFSNGVAVVVTSADRAIQALFENAVGLDKPFDSASLLEACRKAREHVTPSPSTVS